MTITLSDGRANLYQWDTGRTVVLDFDAAQCHFEGKAYGRTVDVDVKGKTAIIPDVLLQRSGKLRVFAFVGTPDEGYTKIEKAFDVVPRNKPSDYVFTPTEQITLETAVTTANEAIATAETAVTTANEAKSTAETAVTTANEAKATADSVRSDADAGKFKGDPGAAGADGQTPYIGENGNWYIGDVDTGKPSRGAKGADGAEWYEGMDYPIGAKNNDLWLYTGGTAHPDGFKLGDVSQYNGIGWDVIANIRGAAGNNGKSAYEYAQDGGFTGTEAQFNKGLSVMGDVSGIDTTVTQNSGNLITSGAVYSYIQSLDANEVKY